MPALQVLVVDDSTEIQLLLQQIVSAMGAEVRCASSGREAHQLIAVRAPQLILLDLGLPDTDGFQFFSELQGVPATREVPVVFITGRSEVTNKIAAFSLGAEDYIVKPFDALEVKARLGARLRKLQAAQTGRDLVVRGALQIDIPKQRVTCDGRPVKLTPKEFLLLSYLAQHEDVVLSRQRLLDAVWGNQVEVFDRTIDTHISSLRRKLGAFATCLEAVPGQGYRFATPLKAA